MRRVLIGALVVVIVASGVIWWQNRPLAYENCTTSRVGPEVDVSDGSAYAGVALDAVTEVDQTTSFTVAPDGTEFVTTKDGTLQRLDEDGNGETVVDLSDRVATGNEQGLLNVAISDVHDELYLYFTAMNNDVHVVAFPYADGEVDVDHEREVLVVAEPKNTHNGGSMIADEDGSLWLGLGDGGAAALKDSKDLGFAENAQTLDDLLGGIIRIDPTPSGGLGYTVPEDNPYVGQDGVRGEIWSTGLRNPWRFSFDRETGDLWVGDVGQWCWEEIDMVSAADGAGAGVNFGWPAYEGRHRYRTDPPEEHTLPVVELPHEDGAEGACSVVGGFVYRGSAFEDLDGSYVYGDSCDPHLKALSPKGDGWEIRPLGVEVPALVSLSEDDSGELYAVSLALGVQQLVPG